VQEPNQEPVVIGHQNLPRHYRTLPGAKGAGPPRRRQPMHSCEKRA